MMDWYNANVVLVQATLTTLLLALSIQVPLRAGVFSFAGVGCFGIGGYSAAIAMTRFGWSTYPSILLGVLLAGAVSVVLGLIVQRLTGLYLGMATIAFSLIISVLAVNGGELTGGASGVFGALGDIGTPQLLVIVLIVVGLLAWSEAGGMGRRVDVVREDPQLAAALGVDVASYRLASMVISGLIGGLAGAVTILLRSTITPGDVNFHLVVLALTVIVVGGANSWLGAAIGSLIFVWLPTLLEFVGEWESAVFGVVVVLSAIFMPEGVVGVLQGLKRRLDRRRRAGQEKPSDEKERVSA
ncbi:MAG: branched-chain amino acid ABC transporter permease [Actinomycetales bacterium]